jgi:hypothetical protein
MKKTYHGSCHCGAVRFECDVDLAAPTSRCNCSICRKTRFWTEIVPADAFRFLSGEQDLVDYSFGSHAVSHRFCSHCGVKVVGQGHMEPIGDFGAVNLAALDDVSDAELAAAPVVYQDGAHNDWGHVPAETRYM